MRRNAVRNIWIGLLVLAIAGVLAARGLWESGYVEFESPARWATLCAGVLGLAAVFGLAARWHLVLRIFLPLTWVFFFLFMCTWMAVTEDPQFRGASKDDLWQIGKAISAYQLYNAGYAPFDERGPLQSLALLYPAYLNTARVFVCPNVTSSWWRRNEGPWFPPGSAFSGAKCHYGYTWHIPQKPPDNFAIMATLPRNFEKDGKLTGWCVLYANGEVHWQETPFCSADPHDNIFSPEPGWSADTDSYIR